MPQPDKDNQPEGLVRPRVFLTLRQAFIGTFRGVKANLLPLTGTFILSLVLAGLLGFCGIFLGRLEPWGPRPGLVSMVLFYLFSSSLLVVGWVSISLKIVRGQKPGVSDLFTGFRKIIPILSVLIFFISVLFLPGFLFGLERPFSLVGFFPLLPPADPYAFLDQAALVEEVQTWTGGSHDELFSEGWALIDALLRNFWCRMNSFLVGVCLYVPGEQGSPFAFNPFAFIFNSTAFFSLWVIADKNKGALASISSVLRIAWGNKLHLFLLSLTLWGIWVAVSICLWNLWGVPGVGEVDLYDFVNPFSIGFSFPSVAFKALMAPLVFIFMAHLYEGITGERTPRPAVIGKEEAATSAPMPDAPLGE